MQNPPAASGSVRYLTISADHVGQRIDNFLMALARSVPKSHIYRIIRTGQVRVNSGRIKPTYRLKLDDNVRVPPMAQAERVQVAVPDALVAILEKGIIFEDDELIVLNKPSGIAVHAGSGIHFGVIDAMRQSRKLLSTKLELIHRLDRGTSGCLMIGKSRQSTLKFQQIFRQRDIVKKYSALLVGDWPEQVVRIDLPLRKNTEEAGKQLVQVDPNGKTAVSHFTLSSIIGKAGTRISQMDITIETGRTHQIRVHAAAQGHPVVGDERYSSASTVKRFRQLGLKRLFLHCSYLEIPAVSPLSVHAPLDQDWHESVQRLQQGC